MTRINIGLDVEILCDVHLLSEHRELVRIPNLVSKGKFNLKSQPKQFTLGKGHVAYFYTRLGYLLERYKQLHQECLARGFNVQDYSSAWNDLPKELMNHYQPTKNDIWIINQRIQERLKGMKNTKLTSKKLV
jgi:deoxyribonuclease (pyrimidine dimer)